MSTASAVLPRRFARARLAVPRPELGALIVLAGALYLWTLSRNGWANEYYAAAVRSMSSSWHAFLYGSFDRGGVMTVDKPPLALWVQALSVRAFGYSPASMLVPQALMGVASVALVYDLVRRRFGRAAGFVGGLALAVTPITVAISRHNNPDAMLVLCCVAALWCFVRALTSSPSTQTRWLVCAGVAVGLGFEAKMAVALMVVPGMVAAWLWVAPRGRVAAVRSLLAGGAAMAVVGLAWPVLMWLTPASDRPWIAGTSDNSIWSLITGYNGVGRITGQAGGPQAFSGAGGPGSGGGGGPFGGPTGVWRLLDSSLGGQAGWLLGFAVVAGITVAVVSRLRRADARTGWILAVGGAFATSAIAFSFAGGIFHPYYVSFLAPFSAALIGAGFAEVSRDGSVARVAGPPAVLAGVVTELVVLHNNPGQLTWLKPVLIVAGIAAACVLAAPLARRTRIVAVGAVLAVLALAPATWAVQTLGHPTNGTFPAGGPANVAAGGFGGAGRPPMMAPQGAPPMMPPGMGQGGTAPGAGAMGGGGPFGGNSAALTAAVNYARQHGGGTVAVASQTGASQVIIKSGAGVAGIGGFSGRESEVSISWLAQAVRDGKIRYVLVESGGMGGGPGNDGRVGASQVMAAVQKAGTQVTSGGLYDLQGKASALEALA